MTAQRTARAARLGPRDVLPCAVKRGAAPATCGDGQTVSCTLSAPTPAVYLVVDEVRADATVQCTDDVASIRLTEHLLQGGVSVAGPAAPERSGAPPTRWGRACRWAGGRWPR